MPRTTKKTTPAAKKTIEIVKENPVNKYVCTCCGTAYEKQRGVFNPSYSALYVKNEGFATVCKECTDRLFRHYVDQLGSERAAIKRMCMKFDIYYSDRIADTAIRCNGKINVFQNYIKYNGLNNRGGVKTYDDYLRESEVNENKKIVHKVKDSKTGKVTQAMIDFWGPGFPEEEYVELDSEYNNWVSRHECTTGAQETLFKSLAMANIAVKKAYLSGDVKKIKDAVDMQQSLMTSANIKPNQKNESIGNELTYGQWIEKLEETRPVGEPDPEWADVDNIGHYFRSWILGTVLDMFKLKNPFKEEYEEEIAKYTAHKPEYQEDEVSSDEIRDAVFGIENAGG